MCVCVCVPVLPQQDLQESDIVALAPIAEDVAEAGSDSDTLGSTIPPKIQANAMNSGEELPTLLKACMRISDFVHPELPPWASRHSESPKLIPRCL